VGSRMMSHFCCTCQRSGAKTVA